VCELCLVDGLPYGEAAEQLGLSVGAVKQRVSRSRARLKKAVTLDEV
jgi:RNA polymerase sigma-70 factor (ECF subfamily)